MLNFVSFLLVLVSCLYVSVQSNPIRKQLCQNVVLSYKVCADISRGDEKNVNVAISLGGSNTFTGLIPVNNPEPLCGGLLGAKVCIEFKITSQEQATHTVCVTVKGTYPFLGTSVSELGCETVSQT